MATAVFLFSFAFAAGQGTAGKIKQGTFATRTQTVAIVERNKTCFVFPLPRLVVVLVWKEDGAVFPLSEAPPTTLAYSKNVAASPVQKGTSCLRPCPLIDHSYFQVIVGYSPSFIVPIVVVLVEIVREKRRGSFSEIRHDSSGSSVAQIAVHPFVAVDETATAEGIVGSLANRNRKDVVVIRRKVFVVGE